MRFIAINEEGGTNPREVDCPGTAIPTPGPLKAVCENCPGYPPDPVWWKKPGTPPRVVRVALALVALSVGFSFDSFVGEATGRYLTAPESSSTYTRR